MRKALVAVAVVAVGAAVAVLLLWPGPAAPSCPDGLRADPPRAARIRDLLAGTERGRELLQRVEKPLKMCFGEVPASVLRSDGVLVMAGDGDGPAAAARLGHLLLHQLEGAPMAEPADRSRPCSALVAEAMRAEARAHALELRLRRRLGVSEPLLPPPVEAEFWAASGDAQLDVVHAYLQSSPEGGPGAAGLLSAYSQRCQDARRMGSQP